jgi:hypothetical protein
MLLAVSFFLPSFAQIHEPAYTLCPAAEPQFIRSGAWASAKSGHGTNTHTRRRRQGVDVRKTYRGRRRSVLICGSVMPALAAVEVPLTIAALLLAAKITSREAARGVRPTSSTVALTIGSILLVVAPVGLGLLLLKISTRQ